MAYVGSVESVGARAALRVALGAGVVLVLIALRWVLDDDAERPLVHALNPSAAPRLLDALVVLVTDFSLAVFGVVFLAWALGWAALRTGRVEARTLARSFPLLGVGIGVVAALALLPHFELREAPLALAPLVAVGFALAGRSFTHWSAARLDAVAGAFLASLLAIALTELALEIVERATPERPRPLGVENLPWGHTLRIIADERVRNGTSYVSGHAAGLFALLAPLFWSLRSKRLRAVLLLWAALHAGSRLYVAAHFPSDVVLGSLLGFALGTLCMGAIADALPALRVRGPTASRA